VSGNTHDRLKDLRQHFSRLPAVLRLLRQAFSACGALKKTRLEDTIRYVQQYLVSAEEQSSREIRTKLKESINTLPVSKLLQLVGEWTQTLQDHSRWVAMRQPGASASLQPADATSSVTFHDTTLDAWAEDLQAIGLELQSLREVQLGALPECKRDKGCAICLAQDEAEEAERVKAAAAPSETARAAATAAGALDEAAGSRQPDAPPAEAHGGLAGAAPGLATDRNINPSMRRHVRLQQVHRKHPPLSDTHGTHMADLTGRAPCIRCTRSTPRRGK
jgi:hypothetical protein